MPPGGQRGNRGGRPPKATHLHVLQGTYRGDRHEKRAKNEPKVTGDGNLPPPPEDAEKSVREAWEQLRETINHRIYTKDDIRAFQTFAMIWAQHRAAYAHIEKHGITGVHVTRDGREEEVLSPQARMWSDGNSKLLAYFARFGMTPADRARVQVVGGKNGQQENPEDEFGS